MWRIIVKALSKRNETGLTFQPATGAYKSLSFPLFVIFQQAGFRLPGFQHVKPSAIHPEAASSSFMVEDAISGERSVARIEIPRTRVRRNSFRHDFFGTTRKLLHTSLEEKARTSSGGNQLFMFQAILSTVNWKWPVDHLVAHAYRSGTLQAVSVSHKERSRPAKADVDSSILSLGPTSHFSLSIDDRLARPIHAHEWFPDHSPWGSRPR